MPPCVSLGASELTALMQYSRTILFSWTLLPLAMLRSLALASSTRQTWVRCRPEEDLSGAYRRYLKTRDPYFSSALKSDFFVGIVLRRNRLPHLLLRREPVIQGMLADKPALFRNEVGSLGNHAVPLRLLRRDKRTWLFLGYCFRRKSHNFTPLEPMAAYR